MAKPSRRGRADQARQRSRGGSRLTLGIVASIAGILVVAGLLFVRQRSDAPGEIADGAAATPASPNSSLTDDQLQGAADELLAGTNPDLPENEYFTDFARDALRWMAREHREGRLVVAFVADTESAGFPATVMMAATRLDDRPTIVIARRRFSEFLAQGDGQLAGFSQRQKNDFTIALVHETVHLQAWNGEAPSDEERALSETAAWRAVNLGVVRPWRAVNQPVDRRFLLVDDGFRSCADQLPCAAVERMVRVTQ